MTHFYISFLSFGQILDFVKYVAHQVDLSLNFFSFITGKAELHSMFSLAIQISSTMNFLFTVL